MTDQMLHDAPAKMRCPKCGRDVWVVSIEYPADQKTDCKESGCPVNTAYLKPYPEFPDEDEVIVAHQISFNDPEGK